MFLPTSDPKFFPYPLEDAMHKEAMKNAYEGTEVLMGFNEDEGSFLMFMSQMKEFGMGVKPSDRLHKMVFDHFAEYMFEEAKVPFVMERIHKQYFHGHVSDLTEFLTDAATRCEVVKTAKKMSMNGRRVHLYRFDAHLDFAVKAFPYLEAGHSFNMHPLMGRPFINEAMYSEEERMLSWMMMDIWGKYINNDTHMMGPFPQRTPMGYAYRLTDHKMGMEHHDDDDKHDGHGDHGMLVKMEMKKCEFLDCLPSLAQYARRERMENPECMEFVMNGAGRERASSLVVAGLTVLIAFLLNQ